jgi:hypothetical protein
MPRDFGACARVVELSFHTHARQNRLREMSRRAVTTVGEKRVIARGKIGEQRQTHRGKPAFHDDGTSTAIEMRAESFELARIRIADEPVDIRTSPRINAHRAFEIIERLEKHRGTAVNWRVYKSVMRERCARFVCEARSDSARLAHSAGFTGGFVRCVHERAT